MKNIKKLIKGTLFIFVFCSVLAFLSILPSSNWSPKGYTSETELEILEPVLRYTNLYYVDKSAISPQKMLFAGLNRLEQTMDEVLVEFPNGEESKLFTVQVLGYKKSFDMQGVTDVYSMSDRVSEVFKFVFQTASSTKTDPRDVEYALVDDMLKTLDSHSGIITPKVYKEFMVETKGSFGGLGIVIGVRDSQLTVIAPIEGTPAYKVGIKPNDKIVQIENESTVNMSLIEAVSKLRGPKGTVVNIGISRKSVNKTLPFRIVRGTIKIESVEAYNLGGGIGYVRIRDFQKNTLGSLKEFTKKLNSTEPLTGIILDLRGNPGGLLDQAQKISDFFLDKGVVVTTRIGSSSRSYMARNKSKDFKGNVVVLVDAGSASASEIVAGALKNNNRAVVIGDRTFGKGSVQQIFDLDDGSALKLTIANYLTPGDISIQDVGITPDIILHPARINGDSVSLTPITLKQKENKINGTHKILENPSYSILYLDTTQAVNPEAEITPEEALTKGEKLKKVEEDVYVKVAKKILHNASKRSRSAILLDSQNELNEISSLEEQKIFDHLNKRGVDWSAGGKVTGKPQITTQIVPQRPTVKSGEKVKITVRVTNDGTSTLNRVEAITESDNPVFSNREFVFGTLSPGQTREWTVDFDVPKRTLTRDDSVTLKFKGSSGLTLPEKRFSVRTVQIPRPEFAYSFNVVDGGRADSTGNGNGSPDRGENVVLSVKVKNIGLGKSDKTVVSLKNMSGDSIFLTKGRMEIKGLNPNEVGEALLSFKVTDSIKDIEFQLSILDETFREGVAKDIHLPANQIGESFKSTPPYIEIKRNQTPIRGGSFDGSAIVGYAEKGSVFRSAGQMGRWIKVWLDEENPGWIEAGGAAFLVKHNPGTDSVRFASFFHEAPKINVSPPELYTSSNEILFSGQVNDSDGVEIVSIFVGMDKVRLYPGMGEKIQFSTKLKLNDGLNFITVVSKDSEGLNSRKIFVIRKTGS